MTAVDRAFIKAYTSRRSMRGASADTAAEPRALAARRDDARTWRAIVPCRWAARFCGRTRPVRTQNRRRGNRGGLPRKTASKPSARHAMPRRRIDRAGRGQRVVVSLADSAITPDWIWQREPHPVFADGASTAGPAIDVPTAKAPPPNPQPAVPAEKPQPPKPASSKVAFARDPVAHSPSVGVPGSGWPGGNGSAAKRCGAGGSAPVGATFLVYAGAADRRPAAAGLGSRPVSLAGRNRGAGRRGRRGARCICHATDRRRSAWPTTDCTGRRDAGRGYDDGRHCAWPAWHARRVRRGACSTPTSIMRRWPRGWESPRRPAGRRCSPAGSGWPTFRLLRSTTIWSWFPCRPMEWSSTSWRQTSAPVLFSMLADIVDLVLVDAGTVAAGTAEEQQISRLVALVRSARLDAVYLVYDERSTTPDELAACAGRLRAAGVSVAGAIANFAAS